MFDTSDAYKAAIKKNNREYDLEITITDRKGKKYQLGRNDLVKNSFSISHQCCGNAEIEIGSVYAAELSVTVISEIDRYSLKDAIIEPFFKLLTAAGWETVPLGKFLISEANKKISCIEIMANDYMIKFEKDFTIASTNGKPYDLLMLCCEACGVPLAHEKKEIESMPNGKTSLSIYEDNDISTYRDLIYYTAQVLGGFATMSRSGKLEIRHYGKNKLTELDARHRITSDFSDFETRYTAVSSTNIRTNIAEYEALETDDALTMNLGVNPLIQYGDDDKRSKVLQEILNSVSVINYVPFSATILCDPSFDLGDCISFSQMHADGTKTYCIASITFTYGSDFTVSCPGKNPLLAKAKSKNEKNIQGLINQSSKNEIVIYSFKNAKEITVGQNDTEIISISYVTKNQTSAEFNAEVVYNIISEMNPVISYYYEIDSNKITDHIPSCVKLAGNSFDTLYYPLTDVKGESVHTFRVYMKISSGSVSIKPSEIMASVRGQGLVSATAPWDGRIEVEDEFGQYTFGSSMKISPFIEVLSAVTEDPLNGPLSDNFETYLFDSKMTFKGFVDSMASEDIIKKNTIDSSLAYELELISRYIKISDGEFTLNREIEFVSSNKEIDRGTLRVIKVDNGDMKSVESIQEK